MDNTRILLKKRPVTEPEVGHFVVETVEACSPKEGEILVSTIFLSVDPYMRGRMRETKSYAPSLGLGDVVVGAVVGEVIESKDPRYKEGDIVETRLGWQTLAPISADLVRKIRPSLAPISTALGILGMPGLTAYHGLLDVGKAKSGDCVVISAASGAVGGVAGQIAKLKGCRVVGIAGSAQKCDYVVNELGFDAAINHRTDNIGNAIEKHCQDGVDVYFDNVGGTILDTVMNHICDGARIVICGMISEYNLSNPEVAVRPTRALLTHSARMQGFIVGDFAEQMDESSAQMAKWVSSGQLKYREDIITGIENTPSAFIGLLRGDNFGKRIIQVRDNPFTDG